MNEPDPTDTNLAVQMFRHNTWANLLLLGACDGLTDEQLGAMVPGTYGTIKDTLLHIIGSEVSYVQRVTGRLPGEPPQDDGFPGFDLLKRDAAWCGKELLQIALAAKPDDVVDEQRHNARRQYSLTGLLVQVINHSTEHRTQIATILTQQGVEPPEMTGWEFMVETDQFRTEPIAGS